MCLKNQRYLYLSFRYDKYIQICKNFIYLYCDIPHEISSCFNVSDFAGATFVCYNTPQA